MMPETLPLKLEFLFRVDSEEFFRLLSNIGTQVEIGGYHLTNFKRFANLLYIHREEEPYKEFYDFLMRDEEAID